jgi:hypothetical protein
VTGKEDKDDDHAIARQIAAIEARALEKRRRGDAELRQPG